MIPSRALLAPLHATAIALVLAACAAGAPSKRHRDPVDPGPDFGLDESPTQDQPLSTDVNADSGAFGPGARPSGKDASAAKADASVDGAASEGGVVAHTLCPTPLAAGDVVITELMVSSRAGAGDEGEWVEVASTRDCWLSLLGVTIESPRGLSADVATIVEDFELPPRGTFLVADSADPAKNHALPGKLFAWNAADVLKNDGDTVTVKAGPVVLDTLTYPAFSNLQHGRSIAFPSDCAASVRGDWQRWSLTFDSWSAGFQGTPNAPNGDVACY